MEISSGNSNNSSYSRVAQAEKEANERIAEAGKRVEKAQHDADQQIDEIKDQYIARSQVESAREEGSVEATRAKGYERIRDTQRAQQAELNRIKRDGEREAQKLQDYYKSMATGLERDGTEKVRDTETQKNAEFNYAQKNGNAQLEDIKAEHIHQVARLQDHQEELTRALTEQDRKQYETLSEHSLEASQQTEEHFQQRFQSQVKSEEDTLNHLYGLANQKIREVRSDTSQKLAAYNARQKDPFYKMMDSDAKVTDMGDHFEMRVTVPEYEQEHVSAILRGNQLVLQGSRRNEERLDLAPGRFKNSSAYQSFQETFPLNWPVDGKKMTREFSGNVLIVKVPKLNEYAFHPQHQPLVPERVHAERPHFPDNIPHTKPEPSLPNQAERERDLSKPAPGSGTLT